MGKPISARPVGAATVATGVPITMATCSGAGVAWTIRCGAHDPTPAFACSSPTGVHRKSGGSGLAILVAGVWAGLLWGADGRLPLLISGAVGGCFAAVLLGRWLLRRAG